MPTRQQYVAAFERERINQYPMIDDFEQRCGYRIERVLLEDMARTLQCPVKRNPPNWQHGRVLYALLSDYLMREDRGFVRALDIGTAKGFSALCMAAALQDRAALGEVVSLDVIDPAARVSRNTIADCDGLNTIATLVAPWVCSHRVIFRRSSGSRWLNDNIGQVHFAFVDGKHSFSAVREEARLLASCQARGDIAVFDDVQIVGVAEAVNEARSMYHIEIIEVASWRKYAIGTRK